MRNSVLKHLIFFRTLWQVYEKRGKKINETPRAVSVEQSLWKVLQIKVFQSFGCFCWTLQNAPRSQVIQTFAQNLTPKETCLVFLLQDLGWNPLYLGFPSSSTVSVLCGASWETAKHNQSNRTDSGCRRDLRRNGLENKADIRKTSYQF